MSTDNYYPAPPAHLCFVLLILFTFIAFPWYMNYEPAFEGFFDQIRLVLIISPLILLLAVHLVSSFGGGRSPFSLPWQGTDSLHQAGGGGTPWGVGFLLVLVLLMISYHSSFKERWFPLLSRSS